MSGVPNKEIEAWEEEGGAACRLEPTVTSLRGTENQVDWGLRIKRHVNEEFDRVTAAFTVAGDRQNGRRRKETETIVAILEEKRLEAIHQVRQLRFQDSATRPSKPVGRHDDGEHISLTTVEADSI